MFPWINHWINLHCSENDFSHWNLIHNQLSRKTLFHFQPKLTNPTRKVTFTPAFTWSPVDDIKLLCVSYIVDAVCILQPFSPSNTHRTPNLYETAWNYILFSPGLEWNWQFIIFYFSRNLLDHYTHKYMKEKFH